MFLECFIGLTEVTKESCCYGYPVTKEKTTWLTSQLTIAISKLGSGNAKWKQGVKEPVDVKGLASSWSKQGVRSTHTKMHMCHILVLPAGK